MDMLSEVHQPFVKHDRLKLFVRRFVDKMIVRGLL